MTYGSQEYYTYLVPCVNGSCGRAGPLGCHAGPYMSYIPTGFLYLSAGVAVIVKIGGHVRLLPQQKEEPLNHDHIKLSQVYKPKAARMILGCRLEHLPMRFGDAAFELSQGHCGHGFKALAC